MEAAARSRSPRRDHNRHLHAFMAAGERLLCSERIPGSALELCRKMLASAEAASMTQNSDWAMVLHRHHEGMQALMDSISVWQMAATSRCFLKDFQDRARKDHDKLQGLIRGRPTFGREDLVSPLSGTEVERPHSPLMVNILNGRVEEVKFMLQFGVKVNKAEHKQWEGYAGCDLCQQSKCKLLKYTFWEVAVIMATSKSPSLRRQQVRELLRYHGGRSKRRLPSKQKFLQHLHEAVEGDPGENSRCRLAEDYEIDDSDDITDSD
eukprot:TRINITY_DN14293_c0_g4_i1.p1 TRINITY_DN14293_c0_g4~~TRINITY_DN14293_c0_g4_i1.p1  ORF type:complete len:265 (-),score=36.77 TRINITY_DN14293_c0_g4_i1:291-1085(-)